jgi:acyl-CoA thioesterase
VSGPVFVAEGDVLLPQPVSRARWYDGVLHGGPVAALFARRFERMAAGSDMQVARLTVDLMRPVPTRPLTVTARVVREGRRIQVVEGSMESEGTEVARSSALRIRSAALEVPDHPSRPPPGHPEDAPVYTMPDSEEGVWFHTHGVEMRFVEGAFGEAGPATVWMRLAGPLVEGEEATPLQRVAAMSDFPNGISRVLPPGWLYINADLTVHLHRYPGDEWVALRARTDIEGGVGLAQAELFDRRGAIGHALQSLFVDTGPEERGSSPG